MTRQEIILAVLHRMDEISPSDVAVDMAFGQIIDHILDGVAREYASVYPIPSSQIVTMLGTSEDIEKGERITPTASEAVKYIKLAEIKTDKLCLREFLPLNHKTRIAIERGVLIPTDMSPYIFEFFSPKPTIEIYPKIINKIIKIVSVFDPTTIPTENDRGFFDNFLWYLAYRTLQSTGGADALAAACNATVENHFKTISTTPS